MGSLHTSSLKHHLFDELHVDNRVRTESRVATNAQMKCLAGRASRSTLFSAPSENCSCVSIPSIGYWGIAN